MVIDDGCDIPPSGKISLYQVCRLLILVWHFFPFSAFFGAEMFYVLLLTTLLSDTRLTESRSQNKTTALLPLVNRCTGRWWRRRRLVMMVLIIFELWHYGVSQNVSTKKQHPIKICKRFHSSPKYTNTLQYIHTMIFFRFHHSGICLIIANFFFLTFFLFWRF